VPSKPSGHGIQSPLHWFRRLVNAFPLSRIGQQKNLIFSKAACPWLYKRKFSLLNSRIANLFFARSTVLVGQKKTLRLLISTNSWTMLPWIVTNEMDKKICEIKANYLQQDVNDGHVSWMQKKSLHERCRHRHFMRPSIPLPRVSDRNAAQTFIRVYLTQKNIKKLSKDIKRVQKRCLNLLCPSFSYTEAVAPCKSGLARLDYRRHLITQNVFREMKDPKQPIHYLLPPVKVTHSQMVLIIFIHQY